MTTQISLSGDVILKACKKMSRHLDHKEEKVKQLLTEAEKKTKQHNENIPAMAEDLINKAKQIARQYAIQECGKTYTQNYGFLWLKSKEVERTEQELDLLAEKYLRGWLDRYVGFRAPEGGVVVKDETSGINFTIGLHNGQYCVVVTTMHGSTWRPLKEVLVRDFKMEIKYKVSELEYARKFAKRVQSYSKASKVLLSTEDYAMIKDYL